MSEIIEITMDDMIHNMVISNLDGMDDKILYSILLDGCPGFANEEHELLIEDYFTQNLFDDQVLKVTYRNEVIYTAIKKDGEIVITMEEHPQVML